MVIKDSLHDQGFPVTNTVGHSCNQYPVTHGHGGIPGEEKVVKGPKREMFIAQVACEGSSFKRNTLHKLFGQQFFIEVQKLVDQIGMPFTVAGFFDNLLPDFGGTQDFFQQRFLHLCH